MRVTFLEALSPLAKKFTANGPVSYPLAKNFTSYEYEVDVTNDGMQQKYELIKEHAAKGHCLYKGNLKQRLKEQSRAGLTDKTEKTQSLILDVDGLPCDSPLPNPIKKHALVHLTEQFISQLPQCFHRASYITHASASMGMKGQRLNLHLEFFINKPISPRALKDVLTSLNFKHAKAHESLSLTASGTALSYPIDVCLADNSRIIYIAPPQFEGAINNPFENDNERIEFVKKEIATVDVLPILEEHNSEQLNKLVTDRVKSLRRTQGLPSKNSKTKTIKFQGENGRNEELRIVLNPDQINLEFVSDNGQWLQFNRLGGDSRGYYVDKNSPNVLRNFKGEDFVLLPKADEDTYDWIIENYGVAGQKTSEPFCFRDYNSNVIFNGFYDPNTNELTSKEIRPTSASYVNDFFAFYGHVPPEVMPQMECIYAPPEKTGIDWDNNIVNRFMPTDYMRDASINGLPDDLVLEFGSIADDLNKICPATATVIWHVLGSDEEAFERFMNWLAYSFQYKDKAGTAWLLHGVPGTGKGVLTSEIIKPLFGENFSQKNMKNIDDDKCKWMEEKLIVVINEFQYENSSNWKAMAENMKMAITDKDLTIRAMRQDQYDSTCWINFIFCSNHQSPIRIEEGDRRYNVPPRQEVPLKDIVEDTAQVIDQIRTELVALSNYFTAYQVDRDAVRFTWENDAKKELQTTTKTTPEEFCDALRKGDLEYFIPLLEINVIEDFQADYLRVIGPIIKRWIHNANEANADPENLIETYVPLDDITTIYNADSNNGRPTANRKVNKLLEHNGLHTVKKRVENTGYPVRCVTIRWRLNELEKQQLIDAYPLSTPGNVTQFKSGV